MADGTPRLDDRPADDGAMPWILRRAAERRSEAGSGTDRPAPPRTWPTPPALPFDEADGDDAAGARPARLRPTPGPGAARSSSTISTFEPVSRTDPGLEAQDRRRLAWVLLVVGLLLVTGFALDAEATARRAERLERTGDRVPGVVVELGERGKNALLEPETVVVEFTWQDRPRRELIHLDDLGPQHREGQPVTVLVDRDDPGHVSIPGEWNEAPIRVALTAALLIGGVVALVAAGVNGAGVRRYRRELERERRPAPPRPRLPRPAWPWVATGLGLLVTSIGGQYIVEGRAEDLERTGARVPGVVTGVIRADDADLLGGDRIVVEFTWQERPRREEIHLDGVTSRYRDGAPVVVLVDRADPDRLSVPGQTNQAPWTLWPLAIGVVGGLGLVAKGAWERVRTRRLRRRVA